MDGVRFCILCAVCMGLVCAGLYAAQHVLIVPLNRCRPG